MVSQRSSASRRELVHLEQNLLPDTFARNTENVPATKDKNGLAIAYTRDQSCSTSVSSVTSTDLGKISAEDHGMAPQPSSVSRRERVYRYSYQIILPAK